MHSIDSGRKQRAPSSQRGSQNMLDQQGSDVVGVMREPPRLHKSRPVELDNQFVPRAIYNDPVQELLLQDEGQVGRGRSRRREASEELLRPLKKSSSYLPRVSVSPSFTRCPTVMAPSEKTVIMPTLNTEPPAQEEARTVILTEIGVDIICHSTIPPIQPLSKAALRNPSYWPVYSPSRHKALPPVFESTIRAATWKNTLSLYDDKQTSAAFDATQKMLDSHLTFAKSLTLRYSRNVDWSKRKRNRRCGLSFRGRGKLEAIRINQFQNQVNNCEVSCVVLPEKIYPKQHGRNNMSAIAAGSGGGHAASTLKFAVLEAPGSSTASSSSMSEDSKGKRRSTTEGTSGRINFRMDATSFESLAKTNSLEESGSAGSQQEGIFSPRDTAIEDRFSDFSSEKADEQASSGLEEVEVAPKLATETPVEPDIQKNLKDLEDEDDSWLAQERKNLFASWGRQMPESPGIANPMQQGRDEDEENMALESAKLEQDFSTVNGLTEDASNLEHHSSQYHYSSQETEKKVNDAIEEDLSIQKPCNIFLMTKERSLELVQGEGRPELTPYIATPLQAVEAPPQQTSASKEMRAGYPSSEALPHVILNQEAMGFDVNQNPIPLSSTADGSEEPLDASSESVNGKEGKHKSVKSKAIKGLKKLTSPISKMFHSKDSLSSATSSRSLAEVGGSDIDDVIEPIDSESSRERRESTSSRMSRSSRISRMKKSSVNPEREATSADTKKSFGSLKSLKETAKSMMGRSTSNSSMNLGARRGNDKAGGESDTESPYKSSFSLKSLISKPIVEENSIPKETAAFEDKSLQPEENLRNTKNLTATSSEFTDYTIVGKTSLKSKEELPESPIPQKELSPVTFDTLATAHKFDSEKPKSGSSQDHLPSSHNLVINLNAAQSKLADENSRLLREELLKTAEKIEKIAVRSDIIETPLTPKDVISKPEVTSHLDQKLKISEPIPPFSQSISTLSISDNTAFVQRQEAEKFHNSKVSVESLSSNISLTSAQARAVIANVLTAESPVQAENVMERKVESISKPASVAAAKEMSNLQEITSGPNKALKEEPTSVLDEVEAVYATSKAVKSVEQLDETKNPEALVESLSKPTAEPSEEKESHQNIPLKKDLTAVVERSAVLSKTMEETPVSGSESERKEICTGSNQDLKSIAIFQPTIVSGKLMDGIQNEKRDNISTFNQKLKTADLSQPTANFVTPTGGDDFTNRMIPKVEESKISAAISETPLPYKSSLSLKSSPLKGSTAEILAAKEVSISKEKIEKMETHQDSQMLYATPGEKERARRRENALKSNDELKSGDPSISQKETPLSSSEPTALLNPTEVEKRTERIEVKAATTTANDSMNIPLNMTLKASLKGVKCEVKFENFELTCTDKGKPLKHFFPIEARRIIKAQQDGDNEVVVTACVTRKKNMAGSKLKKLKLQLDDASKSKSFAGMIMNAVYGSVTFDVNVTRNVLVLVDKFDSKDAIKNVEKHMKPVWDAAQKVTEIKPVQFNEFSVSNVLQTQDWSKVGNIVVISNDFAPRLCQVLVRSSLCTNPVHLPVESDPVDAALAVLKSSIGKSKKGALHVTGFIPSREEGKLAGFFKAFNKQ